MTDSSVPLTSTAPPAPSVADPLLTAAPAAGSLIGGPLPDAPATPAIASAPAPTPAVELPAPFEPLTFSGLTVPEGLVLMDGDKPLPEAEELLTLLNGAKVPAEAANSLLALHDKFLQKASEQYLASWEKTQAEWRENVKKLPEFGGAALDGTLTQIAKVVDKYGDVEFREVMTNTGAGNHPAVVRMMAKIARDMNEAPPTRGSAGSGTGDRANRMFPTQ